MDQALMDSFEVWPTQRAEEYTRKYLVNCAVLPSDSQAWWLETVVREAIMDASHNGELYVFEHGRESCCVRREEYLSWVFTNPRLADHLANHAPEFRLVQAPPYDDGLNGTQREMIQLLFANGQMRATELTGDDRDKKRYLSEFRKRGIVESSPDTSDRRITWYRLTATGEALATPLQK